MSRQSVIPVLAAMALIVCAWFWADMSVQSARAEASVHQERALTLHEELLASQDSTATLLRDYQLGAAALDTLKASVDAAADRARSERRRASALADTLRERLGASGGLSPFAVALVDSIIGAKDQEVYAVEVRLAVALTENAALWRQIETADEIMARREREAVLLLQELESTRALASAWERAAKPSRFKTIGMTSAKIGAGIALALLLTR